MKRIALLGTDLRFVQDVHSTVAAQDAPSSSGQSTPGVKTHSAEGMMPGMEPVEQVQHSLRPLWAEKLMFVLSTEWGLVR